MTVYSEEGWLDEKNNAAHLVVANSDLQAPLALTRLSYAAIPRSSRSKARNAAITRVFSNFLIDL